MPIEIRELHIRVSVGSEDGKQASGSQASAAGAGNVDKNAVVAECVEQVMQILQSKKER
jgi:hypothetical protein